MLQFQTLDNQVLGALQRKPLGDVSRRTDHSSAEFRTGLGANPIHQVVGLVDNQGIEFRQGVLVPGRRDPQHGVISNHHTGTLGFIPGPHLKAFIAEGAFFPYTFPGGNRNLFPGAAIDVARGIVLVSSGGFVSPLIESLGLSDVTALATASTRQTRHEFLAFSVFYRGEEVVISPGISPVEFMQTHIVRPALENLYSRRHPQDLFNRVYRQRGVLGNDLVLQS